MHYRYHAWAWIVWVGGTLVVLSITRNIFYLGLAFVCIGLVSASMRPDAQSSPIPLSAWRFAVIVVPLSALFNALGVHFGRTVLFTLPEWLPLVGGPVTLEALIYGALNGLVVTGIFAAFSLLNKVLPVRSLIRLVPRAFDQVAVVVSIAVTYVPTTLRQFQQIREAQAIRGHRTRGLRDWLPLFLPLLVGGLERALQLAEAMISRGFASSGRETHDIRTRIIMVQGLVALLVGWLLRLGWDQQLLGTGLMVAGVGLVVAALWVVGRRVPHTNYRPEPWHLRDSVIVLGAVLAVVFYLIDIPGINRDSVFYYPYPVLTMPEFDPVIGLATLGFLTPALLRVGLQFAVNRRGAGGSSPVGESVGAEL